MGCCFYDLCSPSRKIYGQQWGGEQCGIPWPNKQSLIVKHQDRQGRECGKEQGELEAVARSTVQGVEGRHQQLELVCAHTTGPASKLPAGKGRDQTINQFNELWLLWVLPVC